MFDSVIAAVIPSLILSDLAPFLPACANTMLSLASYYSYSDPFVVSNIMHNPNHYIRFEEIITECAMGC